LRLYNLLLTKDLKKLTNIERDKKVKELNSPGGKGLNT